MEPRFRKGIASSRRPCAPGSSRPSKALHALVKGFFFPGRRKLTSKLNLFYLLGVTPLEALFTYSPSQLRAALHNPAGWPSFFAVALFHR